MISVREAAELASEFGHEVFKQSGTIEEVEVQGKYWLITLGYEEPKSLFEDKSPLSGPQNIFGILAQQKTDKKYKTFKINGETKEVISAKIHKL